jgi:HK97 family phage portal protein
VGRSLIGRALKVRNQVPVPMGDGGMYRLPGLAMGSNTDEALMRAYGTSGTVFSNVAMLARSTAKPDWKLYRKGANDGRVRYTTNDQGSDQRVEVIKHQALSVLQRPATIPLPDARELVVWSRFALFEISQIWQETTGKSHWIVERNPASNIPLGLWPVRPDRMTPVPHPEKYLAGWVYTAPDGRERIPLGPDEVVYCRYPNPLDIYDGLGPIQSVLVDIDAAKYGAEWNRNFFVNSAEPGGVLQVDHALGDDEFDSVQQRWMDAHRGVSRAHRIALLENGVTWVPTTASMKDMDFANLRSVSRDIIREALAMHKVMTGVTDDVNRANAQTGEEVFASWQIVPRLDRWKDVLNYQYLPLFGSAGDNVEFDYSFPRPLNREADNEELVAKATAAQLLVSSGWDPGAVLEVVGLPDMPFAAPAAPAAPADATPDVGSPDQSDPQGDLTARLRKMLSNGHVPVGAR